jgi:predicted RNase H-like HicB family nuclease
MSLQASPADFELSHEDGWWVATHVETGVASHGRDPNEAVEMAEEAVELSQQDHEPAPEADQQAFLDELGLDIDLGADPIDTPDGMP